MTQTWIVKGYSYAFKSTAPSTADVSYPIDFVWINTTSNIAYILNDITDGLANWYIKTVDSMIGNIRVIGETYLGEPVRTPGVGAEITDPYAIHSHPAAGEFKVESIDLNADGKVVIRYESAAS
uniref:Uncharacterized protein n=1 Tax=viral metagenome TaxID=1070528 RepID=A0A6M3JBI9_9ZZZZ